MNSDTKMKWLLKNNTPIKKISPVINNLLSGKDFNIKIAQGTTSGNRGNVYYGMAPKDQAE